MRKILAVWFVLMSLWCMSCSDGTKVGVYHVSGTVWQDSLSSCNEVTLFVNDFNSITPLTLPVSNGSFSYQGETNSMEELTLALPKSTVHIYAMAGAEVSFQVDSIGQVTWNEADTINGWLASHKKYLEGCRSFERNNYVDSVCRLTNSQIRSALLLYGEMELLNDSLFVRRCLGSLETEAKPEWLMKMLEEQFDRLSPTFNNSSRLPREVLSLSNDTTFGLLDARQESLLLFFWADYDSASIDSLQLMHSIARDFGLYDYEENFDKEKSPTKSSKVHRIELISVCLHHSDSTAWLATVKDLPGKHTWIEGGFAHPLLINGRVCSVPGNLLADRFSNIQGANRWGNALVKWLENTPSKTIASAPKSDKKSDKKKISSARK